MGIYILNEKPKADTQVVEKTDQSQIHKEPDSNKLEENSNKANDGKTVIIEGPLSHVYTQALNMVYSKENYMMSVKDGDIDKISDIESDIKGDVYLYCCDSDDLNNGGLTEVTDKLRVALDNNKGKKVIVAVECGSLITNKIGLLDELTRSIGVEMMTVRTKAVNRLKQLMES